MKLPLAVVFVLLAALSAVWTAPAAATPPAVVVSIAPVHSLIAGVMDGIGAPALLVKGGRSPHDFALRPSDVRRLRRAALVVWVGPVLEPHVARAIAAHAGGARVLGLMARPEIRLLPTRQDGAWDTDDGDADHGEAANLDPHVWLAPDNAIAITATAARALAALDPKNGARYAANAGAVTRRIRGLDAELAQRLAPVRTRRYLVFHDAYRYFEDHYRLSPLGAVSVVAGRAPGARRLTRLRRWAKRAEVRCIFREPQFAPAAVATIRAGTGLAEAVLDPLGAALSPGPDHWFALMRNLADGLVSCLSDRG